MIRVISGTAGGLKLQTVDSDSTRPTLDRVKEAVFSMVQEEISGSVVLDLFAGNGALGIEALSRGAAKCYFNDKSRQCCEVVKKNLNHTKLTSNCVAVCEHSADDPMPEQVGHFTKRKEKAYGTVAVSVYGNEV